MEAAPTPAKRISVGGVVNETFSVYGGNVGALIGSAIVVFVVIGLAAGLLESSGAPAIIPPIAIGILCLGSRLRQPLLRPELAAGPAASGSRDERQERAVIG